MKKLDKNSLDIVKQNIEKLKEIFPDVFTEDKIDFEKLRENLGEFVEESDEKYQFTWFGKKKANQLALTPIKATLRPAKNESKNWETTKNIYIERDNLQVLKDSLELPILHLGRYIVRHKSNYYRLLQEVREKENYFEWIMYMFYAVEVTANNTSTLIENIERFMSDTQNLI